MNINESTSKSRAIRDIENKYGINLTTCSRKQLDELTSKHSSKKVISKYSDIMLNTKQFDLDNMTETERANLKYLVMSTDEVIETLHKKARSIYYKPCEARLRWLMSFNEFEQICAYKLLLNDGILKFNANYKLDPAIYCWLLRTAMWKTHRKVSQVDEITILDRTCNDDSSTTIGELICKDDLHNLNLNDYDAQLQVNYILEAMDKTPSTKLALKANNVQIAYSEYNLAKLFMKYHLGKKELSKMLFNTSNNKLVSNQIFNKFYKQTLMHIIELINKEANECGETFSIDGNSL
jgi:hypothetical protein